MKKIYKIKDVAPYGVKKGTRHVTKRDWLIGSIIEFDPDSVSQFRSTRWEFIKPDMNSRAWVTGNIWWMDIDENNDVSLETINTVYLLEYIKDSEGILLEKELFGC